MSGKDPIPRSDSDFDIFQEGLVKAVLENAVLWQIPDSETENLSIGQSNWSEAWNKVKNKSTASGVQREAKNLERKKYCKILRPFIQRWVFRNPHMNSAAVETCGLKPRNYGKHGSLPPVPVRITIKRPDTGQMTAWCEALAGVDAYGCIVVAGGPLPPYIKRNGSGQWVVSRSAAAAGSEGEVLFIIDESKGRKKKFTGLVPGLSYYFYFYTINARGVSALSNPQVLVCW